MEKKDDNEGEEEDEEVEVDEEAEEEEVDEEAKRTQTLYMIQNESSVGHEASGGILLKVRAGV